MKTVVVLSAFLVLVSLSCFSWSGTKPDSLSIKAPLAKSQKLSISNDSIAKRIEPGKNESYFQSGEQPNWAQIKDFQQKNPSLFFRPGMEKMPTWNPSRHNQMPVLKPESFDRMPVMKPDSTKKYFLLVTPGKN